MSRIFYSCLMTETNSFSPLPTTLDDFKAGDFLLGQDVVEAEGQTRSGAQAIANWAARHDATLVGGLSASAAPGGPTPHADYLELKGLLLEALRDALPVKAVILHLHGAMQSDACFDCEGDLLCAIREIVGANVPIGAVLDPHAHLTSAMVEAATCLIFMKEYPHTDGAARLAELLAILDQALPGSATLHAVQVDCDLVSFFPTLDEPMRGFVDKMQDMEQAPDVASISFVHGFPWGDTPDMGAKLLVYSKISKAHARSIAERLNEDVQTIKHGAIPKMIDVREAVGLASQAWTKPLVLADVADNPGGGASSDSTFLLAAFIDAGIRDVGIGLLYDPQAVASCHAAGVGNTVDLNIGGKYGAASGKPFHCRAQVRNLAKAARMTVLDGVDFPMGDTAWIHINGVDVVLSSLRRF
ncbi:MAG: M81 family metallopeptidase [Pseudomonadota bacterium]